MPCIYTVHASYLIVDILAGDFRVIVGGFARAVFISGDAAASFVKSKTIETPVSTGKRATLRLIDVSTRYDAVNSARYPLRLVARPGV